MQIITLIDNHMDETIRHKTLKAQHGLSIYVETKTHNILFDTGADGKFVKNAKALNVDLNAVDICVISHGHFDHGGGLKAFLKLNSHARVYVHKQAFTKRRKMIGIIPISIGLNRKLQNHPQINFVEGTHIIDDELTLFQNSSHVHMKPLSNDSLLEKGQNGYEPDTFNHEINLLIETDKRVLICGCAHNGIANIIETQKQLFEKPLDLVLGGFHMSHSRLSIPEEQAYVDGVNSALSAFEVEQYYTCHCTGQVIYQYMKDTNQKLHQTRTGTMLRL